MKKIALWLDRVEGWPKTVAMVLMLLIMLIVFSDVLLRYLFNSPIRWAHDVISLYLMAGLFFFALSYTAAEQAHVGVDIIVRKLSESGRRVAKMLTCIVTIPLLSLIAFAGYERALTNWLNGDAISGVIAWPTWISNGSDRDPSIDRTRGHSGHHFARIRSDLVWCH